MQHQPLGQHESSSTPALGLPRERKDAFPDLYVTAAKSSRINRTWYFRIFRGELIAVVVAAFAQLALRPLGSQIADLIHLRLEDDIRLDLASLHFDVSAASASSAIAGSLLPAIAVLFILLFTGLRFYLRLDEKWHAERALAEKTLGLVWRYSMTALPGDLPGALPGGARDDPEYIAAYQVLLNNATDMDLPPPDGQRPIITDSMRELRNAPWRDKATAYRRDRLGEQMSFYLDHAKSYRTMRNRLRIVMIGCYIVGGLLAPFNGLGAFTTAAGALGTWIGAKHYSELAQSYTSMQRELAALRARADDLLASAQNDPPGDAQWGQLVNDVETKLDGEHQEWLRRLGQ